MRHGVGRNRHSLNMCWLCDVDAGMNSHSEMVMYLSRTSSVDGRTERVGFTLLFLFTAEGSCRNCIVLGIPFSPCG